MFRIETFNKRGELIFTRIRKTKKGAETYADEVRNKPFNKRDGVTVIVSTGKVDCDNCGKQHLATPVHTSETQGQIYEVICSDGFSDYYTRERLV